MIPLISPFGVSDDAALFLRHALELVIRRKRDDATSGDDPVHVGLVSAALKLFSHDREMLASDDERQGLVRLLATGALLVEQAKRDARWSRLNLQGDPKWEIEDLLRRASYPLEIRSRSDGKHCPRAEATRKERPILRGTG